jgi:hypothetical protein
MSDRLQDCIAQAAKLIGISERDFRAEAHLSSPKTSSLQEALDIIRNADALPRRRPDAYWEILRHCMQNAEMLSREPEVQVA